MCLGDTDGASVHDVIGTRCDPYTAKLLTNIDYHYCCHSNLLRALVKEKNIKINEAEKLIHDVLNVLAQFIDCIMTILNNIDAILGNILDNVGQSSITQHCSILT